MFRNKWFSADSSIPRGTSQNERFAERLDNVWFKKPSGGIIRLGKLLLTLVERVTKLEEAAKPKLPMEHTAFRAPSIREGLLTSRYSPEDISSLGRTATGMRSQTAAGFVLRAKFRQLLADETVVAQNIQNLLSLHVISLSEGNQLKSSLHDDLLEAYHKLPRGNDDV